LKAGILEAWSPGFRSAAAVETSIDGEEVILGDTGILEERSREAFLQRLSAMDGMTMRRAPGFTST
jgi:hypothetical protein